MPNYSRTDVILIRYPFSDQSGAKLRPAVVVNAAHASIDYIVVPLTSRIASLAAGEFMLNAWSQAGLNVPSAVKRSIATAHPSVVIKRLGRLKSEDAEPPRSIASCMARYLKSGSRDLSSFPKGCLCLADNVSTGCELRRFAAKVQSTNGG